MSTAGSVTRRRFLKASAAASAALAAPAASFARVWGANSRISMGVIGTGGMGTGHVRNLVGRKDRDNVEVLRVCDVYRRRLDRAVGIIGGGEGAGTMEYRELLDDERLDAVLIATPDHWHTKIAIEAMEAGKDVYCEKPLSHTIEQALDCRDAVTRTGRLLQVGPQGTSDDQTFKARRAIRAGRIGKVVWSQAGYCRNTREGQFNWPMQQDAGPHNEPTAPGYVWWDRWLGHEWGLAPKISWNPDHFFNFRKFWPYNGGVATDLLYHKLAPLLSSITGPDGEYPQRVSAGGGLYIEDRRDIPDTFLMTVDYPSKHTVSLVSVMLNTSTPPTVIHGQHGSIEFHGDRLDVLEQRVWAREFRRTNAGLFPQSIRHEDGKEVMVPPAGQAKFSIHTSPRRDHMGNFLDAVRGDDTANCNVHLGCSTMVAIKMAVEAYRHSRTLLWDAKREQVVTA